MVKRRSDRLSRIERLLENSGAVRLRDAARLLEVSEMTVRRDMAACDRPLAYLGGYIVSANDTSGASRYVLDQERDSFIQNKREACRRAAAVIEDGDAVFLDCGTTIPHLAPFIAPTLRLTVVCYSLNLAQIVCSNPNLSVILLGGLYHASSASFFSDEAVAMLKRVGINKAFISAGGVHPTRGVSCSNFHEVAIKRAAMQTALHRYLVVDSSKFGKMKPAHFAKLDEFDGTFTDPSIDPEQSRTLTDNGVVLL
jgi:DeoR family deoxyribose operon repressor